MSVPSPAINTMQPKDLFEILVREHADALHLYLRTVVRDSATADDLFQETLLTAWRTLDRFDRSRPFGPWLRGIAGKLVLAHRRKSARDFWFCDEEVLQHLDGRLTAIQNQPGDTWDEKLAALRRCLDVLPATYREAVELRYRDEQPSIDQMSKQLNVPLEALKKRLQRARSRLLDCLERKLAGAV